MLGLLEPQTGALEYNGHPLQETLSGNGGVRVAYLPQQVFLIDNSLRCNVALGETESEIDESRPQEAPRQARLRGTGKAVAPRSEHDSGGAGCVSLAVNANGSLARAFIMGAASW